MMRIQTHTWEDRLLAWAYEGLRKLPLMDRFDADDSLLENAYAHCAAITKANSRTFYLASSLLPGDKRRAVRALYTFSRITDDCVDKPGSGQTPAEALARWRLRLMKPPVDDLALLAWADTQARYGIPQGYADQLIDGITRDIAQTRYRTFAELAEYCYGVASTVGLMVMHIVGFAGEDALPHAVKLGIALQLTNILRDVGEDWRAGRLYLPLEELEAFNLSEADVAAGRVDDRWRAFLRFQIARTRRLYAEAQPGIALLGRDGRFPTSAAAQLYAAILEDIEAHDYDVFNRRAQVGEWGKVRRLPGIWWETRWLAAARVGSVQP